MTLTESQERLESFARDLISERTADGLPHRIMSRLQEFSGCDGAMFCDARPDDTYAASKTCGVLPDPTLRPAFASRGPLVRWLRANEEILLIPDRRHILSYLPSSERDLLVGAQVRLCLPLISTGRLVALVLLSASGVAPRVPPSVIDLLNACGRRAAVECERVAREQEERTQLEAASRTQQLAVAGQLAAAMAHEVRNPLTAIRSSVQYVIESQAQWPGKVDLLRQVLDEVDRINRTISGVLGLSRPSDLTLTKVELVGIVEQTLSLFAPYFDHRHLQVDRHLDELPIPVLGEAGEIRQVLLNILLNACQATPDAGRITVSLTAFLDGADPNRRRMVRASIADSGAGMTGAQLAKAFEPFFTTKETGTGLGLSICRQILTRHGGDIRLESAVGQGTTATLSWPVADA